MIPLARHLLAVIAAGLAVAPGAWAAAEKPNIVYVLLDDMGYSDPGAYGGTVVQTPRMDLLATQGMRFTRHYANAPVCTPSRMALMTGHYSQQYGIRRVLTREFFRGIPGDVVTLPEVLATAGYVSGHFGKWHMGQAKPEFLPLAQGYDEAAILDRTGGGYWNQQFLVNDATPLISEGHLTRVITDMALAFITAHQDEPFFLSVWHNSPHTPYEPTPEWESEYPSNSNGRYAALISDADEQIGEMIDHLDSLGIGDDTLFIVTSDNGAHDSGFSTGDFRGIKGEIYEGGLRVPYFARWPGVVPAGAVNTSLTMGFDLIPTLAEQLGLDTTGLGLEGRSFLPALTQNQVLTRDEALFWETKEATRYFTALDGEWNRYAVRQGRWKLTRQDTDVTTVPKLFDLDVDPGETSDLAAGNPQLVADLSFRYRRWRGRVGTIRHAVADIYGDVSGSGMDYDFTQGRMDLIPTTLFDFNDGDFTFVAELTVDSTPAVDQVVAEKPGSWRLSIDPQGYLKLFVEGPSATTTLTSLLPVPLDLPVSVAFTVFGWRQDESTVRLYLEGVEQQETNAIEVVSSSESTIHLGNSAGMDLPLDGLLAHPRFYVNAHTPAELADQDFDHVGDARDNCPADPNPFQRDSDGDLVGDVCDPDCLGECAPTGSCGDGLVQTGETCDDSNLVDGDGCSAECALEQPKNEVLALDVASPALPADLLWRQAAALGTHLANSATEAFAGVRVSFLVSEDGLLDRSADTEIAECRIASIEGSGSEGCESESVSLPANLGDPQQPASFHWGICFEEIGADDEVVGPAKCQLAGALTVPEPDGLVLSSAALACLAGLAARRRNAV